MKITYIKRIVASVIIDALLSLLKPFFESGFTTNNAKRTTTKRTKIKLITARTVLFAKKEEMAPLRASLPSVFVMSLISVYTPLVAATVITPPIIAERGFLFSPIVV